MEDTSLGRRGVSGKPVRRGEEGRTAGVRGGMAMLKPEHKEGGGCDVLPAGTRVMTQELPSQCSDTVRARSLTRQQIKWKRRKAQPQRRTFSVGKPAGEPLQLTRGAKVLPGTRNPREWETWAPRVQVQCPHHTVCPGDCPLTASPSKWCAVFARALDKLSTWGPTDGRRKRGHLLDGWG